MKKLSMIILLLTISMLMLSGCTKEEPVSIRGEITSLQRDYIHDRIRGSILVEGEQTEDTSYDRASVRLTKDTIYVNDNNKKITIEDLKEGQIVEIWFTGSVAESYPVQATAAKVKIINE